MIQKLRSRLTRLERQPSWARFGKGIDEMNDEDLLRCAGLPPDANDEDIAALMSLGETAPKEGTP